jgi:mannan endo-1,4-beta-mannosidase
MDKNCIHIIAVFFILAAALWAQERPGFYVKGRHLYDYDGQKVILRGVANPNIWFEKNGIPRYSEIEKTGANCVRIVWETKGTAEELDEAITNCINAKMIPMIECHDATGDWSKLGMVVDYWTDPDIVDIIQVHEEYLLLNIANECGDYFVNPDTFKTGYQAAVLRMREAGIHVPLVIDGTDWGKNINVLQSKGPELIAADPDSNLIFSVHMWWPAMYGYSESDIINEIAQSVNMNLPLIVGEFSQMHGDCDDEKTQQNSIAYLTIIEQCQLHEVGWIAWSWFGNCNPLWDMTTDGTFETLYDWGLEVALTNQYSIQNTSVRPVSIAAISDRSPVYPAGFELEQNYPNPFNASTQIEYEIFFPAEVTLTIYDITGKKVKTLVEQWASSGTHSVIWNGMNDLGFTVSSGVYIYQLTVKKDDQIIKKSNKLILLK